MRDIVISERKVRRELRILLGCFVFAVLFDLFGVIKFGKPFTEVFRTIGYEIVITVAVYLILAVVRLFLHLFFGLFRRRW